MPRKETWDWVYVVECDTCTAGIGHFCVTLSGRTVYRPHRPRQFAALKHPMNKRKDMAR